MHEGNGFDDGDNVGVCDGTDDGDTVGDDDGEFEGAACGADVVVPPVPPWGKYRATLDLTLLIFRTLSLEESPAGKPFQP